MMEIIQGICSCGEPISIELNADPQMCARTDRKRPFYPDENVEPEAIGQFVYSQDGVTVFRCRKCSGWIADTVPEASLEVQDA
ncbi:TPA: hypothetical protein U2L98_000553 [Enterobacter hormaechei]|uniref:hypothetical protein n=2 Tax=Enterobacter hormaechei TaxID=158836 RepID=UPI000F885C8E|nr:hypothetical protein [Enterobacter hormaechei]MCE1444243.1 hypothetical protein [Enterobacter hormaechei]MCE1452613.1 hypothetical protein [Enterobacter hormaechei]RTO92197.1 hypothetical protein EKN54_02445 [Enterobacter hormaechei]HEM8101555.1 hypothetical protein [Enterobacter hormaechei]HEM8123721.1 hypothetical protein [Enterobacter hormaechei]